MSTASHSIPDEEARQNIAIPDQVRAMAESLVVFYRTDMSLTPEELVAFTILAERKRCEAVCTDHISVLRKLFQNDVARAIEQVRAEIKAVSA